MNDDLFNYLVATDQLDDFLGYKGKKDDDGKILCPNCGNEMVDIIYGMPSSEAFEDCENKKLFLGGCLIDDNQPVYHCYECNRSYYDNLMDYIVEDDNWNDEDI